MVLATIGIVAGFRSAAVVRLVDGLVLCGLIASATAWIGVAFHRDPWGLVAQGIWRGSSTLTYANATGALVGIGLLLAVARLPGAHRLAALPAYGLLVGLLSTGSRAALVSVGIGVLVLAHRRGWGPTARALVPIVVGGLVGAAALVPSLSADAPAQPGVALVGLVLGALVVVTVSSRVVAGPLRGPSAIALVVVGLVVLAATAGNGFQALADARFDIGSADRAAEWRAATEEFGSSPVVGVGPGRLDLSWAAEDGGTYVAAFAHNEYLELLATHGLVGAIALAVCVVLVVRRRSRVHSPTDRDGAVAALAVLAVHSGFDFLWHIPVLALVGGVLVAIAAFAPQDEASIPSTEALAPSRDLRQQLESLT
jgi:O-Antigen ligase